MSFILTLLFPTTSIPGSLQVGDIVYYTPLTQTGGGMGFDYANTSNIVELGKIIQIIPTPFGGTFIKIKSFLVCTNNLGCMDNGNTINMGDPFSYAIPGLSDFIMFGKDNSVNTTSLIGYYADVHFVNNSTKKAELFSVGSEIAESSK